MPFSDSAASVPVVQHRFRDETLDPANPSAYNLYITAGPAGIRLGLAEVQRNKFVLLEDYAVTATSSLAAQLQALTAEHELLRQAGWQQVRLAVQNRDFTLLPAPLFRPGDEATYLRLHHGLQLAEETLHYYEHTGLDMVSVFATEKSLSAWLQASYSTSCLLHQTSALIEGIVHQSKQSAPRQLYLHVNPQELTLVAVQGKRLEFCNIFPFSSAEDFIYYTILVMQELQLNPDQDSIVVWGDLLLDSELFTILRKYVRNVRFGTRPFDLAYSYRLNDVFDYRYFELYSLHLCK
ncbi:DUF3822 family protein [Hymenobacter cavernae]|uniref:DUF3822 family protein n=1 Tax=Hymenobacter cavernae TaxID=2044852 RepID=A0ABQ1UPB4_9BACT|nr:DUF3822 family protein [Hymenobacter cavernae]GGF23867.1 hypothetical protein GCM10011383_39400 [Hymenobacter cavernae]